MHPQESASQVRWPEGYNARLSQGAIPTRLSKQALYARKLRARSMKQQMFSIGAIQLKIHKKIQVLIIQKHMQYQRHMLENTQEKSAPQNADYSLPLILLFHLVILN